MHVILANVISCWWELYRYGVCRRFSEYQLADVAGAEQVRFADPKPRQLTGVVLDDKANNLTGLRAPVLRLGPTDVSEDRANGI